MENKTHFNKNYKLLRFTAFIVGFIAFFLFFFLRNDYYKPACIKIEGYKNLGGGAMIQVDDGEGYNKYQTIKIYGNPYFIPKENEIHIHPSDRIILKYDTVTEKNKYIHVKGQAWITDIHSIGCDIKVILSSKKKTYSIDTYQYPGERDFLSFYNNSESAFDCFFEKKLLDNGEYQIGIQITNSGKQFYASLDKIVKIKNIISNDDVTLFSHLGAMRYNKNIISFDSDEKMTNSIFLDAVKERAKEKLTSYISTKQKVKISKVANNNNFMSMSFELMNDTMLNKRDVLLSIVSSYGSIFYQPEKANNNIIEFNFDSKGNRNEIVVMYLVFPYKLSYKGYSDKIAVDSFPLPQTKVKKFRIISPDTIRTFLHIKGNDKIELEADEYGVFTYENLYESTKTENDFLFIFQILSALFMAWLIYELISLYGRYCDNGWKNGIKNIILGQKRRFFWILFVSSFIYFFLWLVGQWPGAMSIDSLELWSQVNSLEIMNGHPYTNALLYLFLVQFADTPAIIPLFHILIVSGLSSYIFYYLYKNGFRLYLLLPFILAFHIIPTIALFNLLIWKDIIFAILTTFWGFLIYTWIIRKKRGEKINLSLKQIVVLALLLTAVCIFRHNGIIYIVFIPIIIGINRIFRLKTYLVFTLLSILFLVWFRFIVPENLGFNKSKYKVEKVEYMKELYEKRIETLFSQVQIETNQIDCQEASILAMQILEFDEMENDTLKTVLNIEVLSKMTVNMLDCLLYPKEVYFNALEHNHYRAREDHITYSWWKEYPTAHNLHIEPLSKALYTLQHNIIKVIIYPKLTPVFFNNIFSLFIVLFVMIFFRKCPGTASFAFLIFIQFLAMFLIGGITYHFRYIYFLYFSSFFLIPMFIFEWKIKKMNLLV